jgi:hypothetical protein
MRGCRILLVDAQNQGHPAGTCEARTTLPVNRSSEALFFSLFPSHPPSTREAQVHALYS